MSEPDYLRAWLRLWNGRLDMLKETVHPDFVARVPGIEPFDRDALRALITRVRTHFDVFSSKPELGPITQGEFVSGRWVAVAVSAGESSYWVGHSIFRIADQQIIEHWEISAQTQGFPFDISDLGAAAEPL